jgi:uncharacterized protein YecT (DUF1311 family)
MRLCVLISFASIVAGGLTSAAFAAESCANASNQSAMNQCADKAYRASDAKLNDLYRQIKARLKDDKDTAKMLVSAQKAWVAYRDAECNFASSGVAQGSMYPMTLAGCLDGETQKRIASFKAYLRCQEGDPSCPVPAAD